jgi:outer membrane autotransporter protein
MRAKTIAALISLACVAISTETRAQVAPPAPVLDCSALDISSSENEITACAKPLINRQSLTKTSSSIRNIILDRFDMGPNQTEPAGLELTGAEEIAERMSGNGTILIAPTADVAAPAASAMWNIWVDGKYSWLDDDSAFSDLDGSLVNLIVGADYKFTDRLVLGVMGTYETSDLEGSGVAPPTQDTDGWGGGAYLGLTLTDNLVFSANVLGTELDTDVNGGAAEFDSTRIQASSALTGYWYSGTWRYSPSVTVAWSKEWQDAAAALNAQTIETWMISPGVQLGNTIALGGTTTVEPWLGAQFDWVPFNKVVDDVLGTILDDDYTDLRLQSGLNFAFGANAQLALTGEISGLLLKNSDTYTAGANFAYQF